MSFFAQATDRFLGTQSNDPTAPTMIEMLLAASKMQDLLKGQSLRTSMRVAVMAGSMAKRMALPVRDVHAVVYAAMVYDLGLATIAADVYTCLPAHINEKRVFSIHGFLNTRGLPNARLIAALEGTGGIDTPAASPTAEHKATSPTPEKNPHPIESALNALTPMLSSLGSLSLSDLDSGLRESPPKVEAHSEAPLRESGKDLPVRVTDPMASRAANLPNILARHPLALSDFCHKAGLSSDVKAVIEAHHELCDGSGYPYGLTRHDIPMGARILCLADAIEGVLAEHDRSKNHLVSRQQALENFLAVRTLDKFETEAVAVFKEILEDYPDFMKLIAGREVETMCRNLVSEREEPLSGGRVLAFAEALASLVDNITPLYRQDHSKKVADTALKMAERLGINKAQAGELLLAALLHDIGMIDVPVSILLKQGSLSEAEWKIVKEHPHWTQEILKHIPSFANVVLWAAEHHERLNGRGYPLAKKGVEISTGGRVIALADVFDALTSPRPYRTHVFEPMDALPIIGQSRYTQFDNHLVSLLRTAVLETELVVK
ncbi:MAG: HD domain-containing phosphohydrolase [Vampirovibrionales bacterium]|nr:HD domain-containing phosphohydrolase [Vampirovibrionales bacterium]